MPTSSFEARECPPWCVCVHAGNNDTQRCHLCDLIPRGLGQVRLRPPWDYIHAYKQCTILYNPYLGYGMTNLVESWFWHIELALSPHIGSEILFLLSRDNHLTSMENRANLVSSASMVSKMGEMLPAYLVLVTRLSLPPGPQKTWQVPQHINEDIPKIRR